MFIQLRSSNKTIKEALAIKRELQEAKLREEKILNSWRQKNPWETLTPQEIEDLGIGSSNYALSNYIDRLRDQGKEQDAELVYGVVNSEVIPTNCFIEEFLSATDVKERRRKERDKHLEELTSRFPVLPIVAKDVKLFVLELQQKGLSAKTINKRLSNWRVYYQYLLDLGHINDDKPNPFVN
ncbi:site-specific integrase [Pseudoalteromonas piscicida]|uniref:site-specific integrase n=1 Tax=Pseudoalteromonas piscicida TaxID=43662 RepID=UPI000E35CFCE|nr:site-specific integrase [Pseudoalteromonas piscicida]AXQ97559.1 hypothetical protein D0N37_07205 [Pseudoalteromonas piscicida]